MLKTVISASRRTDIPAFYMQWFMEQINNGYFEVINPYNNRKSLVPATPDKVNTLAFWSKNFNPFIIERYGEKLMEKGFHLFFNFTVNSESQILEPEVPPLKERFDQIDYLCKNFGYENVQWRFDPICFFKDQNGVGKNNLRDFLDIAKKCSAAGISTCITSFVDLYPKIIKRILKFSNFSFIDPPMKKKTELLSRMENQLLKKNIKLYTCCEKKALKTLPKDSTISASSCISGRLLSQLSESNLSNKKDAGQRINAGCGCSISSDIGSYSRHPCFHNCLFCYANPSAKRES